MNWPTQPLSSLGTVKTGSTPSTSNEIFWSGEIPFVTPSELDQSIPITITPRTLSDEGGREARLLQEGAVLVCCIGSLGKIGIAGRIVATNQQINSIEFDPQQIWPKFGYYACQKLKSKLLTMAPATTVPIVNKSKFEQLEIPVPSLSEQRRIAAILDQADALRAKRKEALTQLDSLTQSIFIEMFGDPMTQSSQWQSQPISNFVAGFESGKSVAAEDENDSASSFRVLKVSAVTSLEYKPQESKAAPVDYMPKQSYFVKNGDLLFSRANTTDLIGATAYVSCTPPNLLLSDKLWRFVWHEIPRAEPLFVNYLFRQPRFRAEIGRRASGTSGSMKNISQNKVLSISVGFPPLEFQRTFANLVTIIDELKTAHRTALIELDALFASLQHRAFRGEL